MNEIDLDLISRGVIVPEGGTLEVTKDFPVVVDFFVMHKNSRITFAPDIRQWELTARKCRFYSGAVIDADGKDAPTDAPPPIPGAAAPGGKTKQGNTGAPGTSGQKGENGVDITLRLGIELIEDVLISVNGGDSQPGGQGQRGGSGGRADVSENKRGGPGGTGGIGGAGTDGGDSGKVLVEWWEIDRTKTPVGSDDLTAVGLRISADGGNPGAPGPGGPGGAGGPGKCEKKIFKICKGGGPPGGAGGEGASSQPGSSHKWVVKKIPK